MKKSEIVNLYDGLNAVNNFSGVTFGYALNKNISIIKSEIEALQKSITPSKEFLEYDTKRVDIVKKYTLKDEKGELIIKDNQYDVGDKKDEVEKEVSVLKEEYKKFTEERDQQVKEYNELLEKESNVELYKIKKEDMPDAMTAAQMASIFLIVEE